LRAFFQRGRFIPFPYLQVCKAREYLAQIACIHGDAQSIDVWLKTRNSLNTGKESFKVVSSTKTHNNEMSIGCYLLFIDRPICKRLCASNGLFRVIKTGSTLPESSSLGCSLTGY
jgi:hypothetical protein